MPRVFWGMRGWEDVRAMGIADFKPQDLRGSTSPDFPATRSRAAGVGYQRGHQVTIRKQGVGNESGNSHGPNPNGERKRLLATLPRPDPRGTRGPCSATRCGGGSTRAPGLLPGPPGRCRRGFRDDRPQIRWQPPAPANILPPSARDPSRCPVPSWPLVSRSTVSLVTHASDRPRWWSSLEVSYTLCSRAGGHLDVPTDRSNVPKDKGVSPKRMGCERRSNLWRGCPFIFFQ